MQRRRIWYWLVGILGCLLVMFSTIQPAKAINLDEAGTLQLAGVFYNQWRLRTTNPWRFNTQVGDWTTMQHRYFVDPQLRADVLPWMQNLPLGADFIDTFQINEARFFFNPRFEYDGVYDYGPRAFRDDLPPRLQKGNRLQLFEVYGDLRLFRTVSIRAGRQNLSWGETDGFRLLDRINPLDNGFGGFLIPLDERRRPLTMIRASVGLGDYPEWELYNTTLQAFIAPDKRLPQGAPGPTPWGVQGAPSPPGFPPTLVQNLGEIGLPLAGNQLERPNRNLKDSRWGTRLLWTWHDVSFSLAYMQTYPDGATPSLQLNSSGQPIIKLRFPRMHVVGLTASSPLPAPFTYTVFRSELAGFINEPFFIEQENFALGEVIPKRNVIRGVLGLDHTQWIRTLNPANTFFFTGQFFYTNIQGSVSGLQVPLQRKAGRFINVDREGFLNTLAVNTLYSAGYFFNLAQLQPAVTYFYDWEGAWLFQPSLTFLRDPFRFRIEYNWLEGRFIGIGLLKDKDNLAFRIDYLL